MEEAERGMLWKRGGGEAGRLKMGRWKMTGWRRVKAKRSEASEVDGAACWDGV